MNFHMIEDDQSKEIKAIYEKFNALADMMGQMHEMVMEQGTVIDRIDYNLTQASIKVKKGNKFLQEAKETAESGFANKCIKILALINLVLFVLVLLKMGR